MKKIQTKHRAGGVLVRDFDFNEIIYFHSIYTDDDSILLSAYDDHKTILVFDSSMNVWTVNDKDEPVELGHFSLRGDYWQYHHTSDPEIFKHMSQFVMPDKINMVDQFVKLEHSRGVEAHLDSEVFVSKMYLSYLITKEQNT